THISYTRDTWLSGRETGERNASKFLNKEEIFGRSAFVAAAQCEVSPTTSGCNKKALQKQVEFGVAAPVLARRCRARRQRRASRARTTGATEKADSQSVENHRHC